MTTLPHCTSHIAYIGYVQASVRMIHLNEQPLLSDLSALVLHHSVVLILLIHFCAGQSQIVAMVGDDIILPCHLEPAVDAVSMTVEWARTDLNPRFVHVRRGGVELLIDQNPLYVGRTSLSINKLKHGDVSLKLSKVKLTDKGMYRCLILTQGTTSEVELYVGSVSSPVVRLSKDISGLLLDCKSAGWYPEPEVFWLDGEGNLLSAGPTETVRGPDDLYTVSSRVTVEKSHSNSFTCRVQQKDINQTRQVEIHIADDFFSASVGCAIWITVAACLMCALLFVLGFAVWKCRCRKNGRGSNGRGRL